MKLTDVLTCLLCVFNSSFQKTKFLSSRWSKLWSLYCYKKWNGRSHNRGSLPCCFGYTYKWCSGSQVCLLYSFHYLSIGSSTIRPDNKLSPNSKLTFIWGKRTLNSDSGGPGFAILFLEGFNILSPCKNTVHLVVLVGQLLDWFENHLVDQTPS